MSSRSKRSGRSSENDSIPFEGEHSLGALAIVDLFSQSFQRILDSPDLPEFIQVVKGSLYERQFLEAFDDDNKRFAYAARWTPARSLAYASLFSSLEPVKGLFEDPDSTTSVLCVGGGAGGELVGLASVFCRLKEHNSTSTSNLVVKIVDIADWSAIVTNVTKYMQQNWLYKPEKLTTQFIHKDILGNGFSAYGDLDLITLMFTTNELFSEKRAETIRFLQTLNRSCKQGAHLLIAESAGSYSHITVGTKKFPVQFIIDTVLLGKQGEDTGAWDLVDQSDSCWYRIDEKEVDYPMKLENMRFFYRLYEKK
ncbi:25S rRNA (uracil(2843)-N(3))-methyltransferase [Yamadazyma tenuis]|uniref:25S rRNA (Uridine(2843)-N(3))-methyltransferase n=1 Tax=Candida tenuis (strain ATCC 10573 / BCRC 21748 / CBS 615 / JCM 9827 / NBRC 10315 / NRRL Y-1498 / VKM Y-70) TaxID=590646 RepID=G3BCE5_CANTC|nr:uncharacterized protein CANTEDRAFT_116882 [Yamadazyma tenuis ATCC 10573]XP_006690483.1 uncharacterized protein CANTEDRAFT_116882 [Yamadazyma tenuis ATCC 10573]EGV61268.1 hypothetical protein CANTEDRAFT_116882 [Yamadazyma tenuis ATCC 10573]EGV61269.1 hypothetical protein CANTEDRAFT_116882 [Yamadazyma tenuis ATCC 10573]WEJ93914.1 25S rRNA (uracil(2843)-N(3))-methyltransferase [Yamadazyma tenuis]